MVIVGIQHLHDGLCQVFLLHCLLVIALIEFLQIKGIHWLGVPDPQGIDHIIAVAHDGDVVGDCQNRLVALLDKMVPVAVPLGIHIAAEFYLCGVFGAADLKGIAVL